MTRVCHILPPSFAQFAKFQNRDEGCPLPSSHDGPHHFQSEHYGLVAWESDLCPEEECDCDGDWCIAWTQLSKAEPS